MNAKHSRDGHADILSMTPSVSDLLDQVRELQGVARNGTEQDLLKHLNRTGWVPPIIRMSAPEPWVGTAEVARLLGQTPSWVRTRSSLMPHIRIGHQYRFRLSEIEGWYKQWFAGDRMEFAANALGMNPELLPQMGQ
jgi:hypothetical protein